MALTQSWNTEKCTKRQKIKLPILLPIMLVSIIAYIVLAIIQPQIGRQMSRMGRAGKGEQGAEMR